MTKLYSTVTSTQLSAFITTMKQSLQLKMGQQLTMTSQLQQAIRLLQLSTLDLQQEIQEALDSNPMLEVEEPQENTPASNGDATDASSNQEQEPTDAATNGEDSAEWNESIPNELPVDTSWDDVYQSAPSSSPAYEGDESDYDSRYGTTDSLYDHLTWQLNLTPMSDRDQVLALALIDAIEPGGMLSVRLDELHADLQQQIEDLEFDELQAVQRRLQQFDPCGVASQDLSECLLVQLQQFDPATPYLAAAKLIVKHHLPLLGSRDYRQLMRRTKLKEAEL